ncbi:DUF4209 domain-containing protein [Enterobacter chuandaensis]|uniref:DUF4209 domain-containing protein n=1 Tax=Enterobacter chuandaensis TaxID=2497875 RepID=UPI001C2E56C6|nr:DUF4209 domain-containing protein [Enterobacter chuandaensis]
MENTGYIMGNNHENHKTDGEKILLPPVVLATRHDFSKLDLNMVLSENSSFDYYAMSFELETLAKRTKDDSLKHVYQLLAAICSFHLRIDDPLQPWGPRWEGKNQRTYIPSDFRGEQNNILAEILPNITNLLLRGRIADVIWCNDKKNIKEAGIAIDAYCDAIIKHTSGEFNTEDSPVKLSSFERIFTRSLQIITLSRKKGSAFEALLKIFEIVRLKAIEEKHYIVYERIARLGCNKKLIGWEVIALEAKQLASLAEKTSYPEAVKKVWCLAAAAFEKSGDKDACRFCQKKAVEQTLRMRDEVFQASAKAYWISVAIGELRAIGGQKEWIKELFEEQRTQQMEARDENGTFTIQLNTQKEQEDTKRIFSGLSLSDSLFQFAVEPLIPTIENLKTKVDSNRKKYFFSNFMSSVYTDAEGKVYARTPAASVDKPPTDEWYKAEYVKLLDLFYHNILNGFILPVRYSLSARFSIEERHFEAIVALSPFVPETHHHIFALGFARMFQGDYATSAYLLIPQLENSIRFYMLNINRETSKMNNQLLQEDRSLSGLLENMHQEMVEVFGEDLINTIDLLFNYKPGPSLRHEVAHGKLSTHGCFNAAAVYACWLIYRLVCWPLSECWDSHVAPAIEESE